MSSGRRNRRDELEDESDESDDEEVEGDGDDEVEGDGDDEVEDRPPATWFYPMPLGRLVIFGLLGSAWFCMYWMYRCWSAYRAAWGYSKRDFWQKAHAATGFRVSAFWRAALSGLYCFALFPAVERESKAARLPGVRAPVALAFSFTALALFTKNDELSTRLLCTPVWALLPVQVAINRLNARAGVPISSRTNAAELAFVALGAFTTYAALGAPGVR